MLRIENCLQLATKNNMLFARGSSLFQGAINEICLAKFSSVTCTFDVYYSEIQVSIQLQNTTMEQIANIFPSSFHRLTNQTEIQFININLLCFVNLAGNNLNLRFKNGIFTIYLDNVDSVAIFSRIASLLEMMH